LTFKQRQYFYSYLVTVILLFLRLKHTIATELLSLEFIYKSEFVHSISGSFFIINFSKVGNTINNNGNAMINPPITAIAND